MEYFGGAVQKAIQEYLKMSQLTRGKVGCSDNNKAGKTTYLDASMV
jgi:hypothetical protein